MNYESGIAALTLLFAVLVVPPAGAQETAKSADKAPTSKAATDLETQIVQKPRYKERKPAVRCEAHTGSILPRRGKDCVNTQSELEKEQMVAELRRQQKELEIQRMLQRQLAP